MADKELQAVLSKLRVATSYTIAAPLLSQAKLQLLKLNALTPPGSSSTVAATAAASATLRLAREVFEHGALLSIRATLPDVFVRYVNLLRPFYEAADDSASGTAGGTMEADDARASEQRSRITGLYLLLLLTQGDYSSFHTELEGLQARWSGGSTLSADGPASRGTANGSATGRVGRPACGPLEEDRYLGYPIKLERWLMEGAYDLVWKAMASREVPSEEYGVFSQILTTQIRSEIASCSERAYTSLPISSAKNLLFLDSEGAVVSFATERGWLVRDGRIYFPSEASSQDDEGGASGLGATTALDGDVMGSATAIENTLGYARELETIV